MTFNQPKFFSPQTATSKADYLIKTRCVWYPASLLIDHVANLYVQSKQHHLDSVPSRAADDGPRVRALSLPRAADHSTLTTLASLSFLLHRTWLGAWYLKRYLRKGDKARVSDHSCSRLTARVKRLLTCSLVALSSPPSARRMTRHSIATRPSPSGGEHRQALWRAPEIVLIVPSLVTLAAAQTQAEVASRSAQRRFSRSSTPVASQFGRTSTLAASPRTAPG